jgi:signal transduction histidine kinase
MWYILALSIIATVALVGQVLIQRHLKSQVHDSRVVNLAGTQRYKSQEIVKLSVLLHANLSHKHFSDKTGKLTDLLGQWKRVHEGLQNGDAGLDLPGNNSEVVREMFAEVQPYFQNVYDQANEIIRLKTGKGSDTVATAIALQKLFETESVFLEKMDRIVFQYDQEARQNVAVLSKLEYSLLGITLVVIVLEIVFIFRPTTVHVNRTINQLTASEKNAHKLSKEIGALYASLEKSYEQISLVNQPVENPRLYAKADKGGNVTFIAEAFAALTGKSTIAGHMRLCDLFDGMDHPDDWMDEVVEVLSDGGTWQGELHFKNASHGEHWVDVVITPVYHHGNEIEELVMMGAEITGRKVAEGSMRQKNRAEIEKKINQQKFRSVLILEGQEEERKRIAMDIHDGIGQMLTSLKFQIESIDLHDGPQAERKIREIGQLTKDVIKEVRRVTFNLKPTVLGDYGLSAALNVFVQEIGKLTDVKLVYRTTGEMERLPQKIENNIFRIIQEAINNAIKYSGAEVITIDLLQSEQALTITVHDAGKGFDSRLLESRSMDIDSGRGFFNMYERTEYVNGNLRIDAAPGKGTTVTLTVPIRAAVGIE